MKRLKNTAAGMLTFGRGGGLEFRLVGRAEEQDFGKRRVAVGAVGGEPHHQVFGSVGGQALDLPVVSDLHIGANAGIFAERSDSADRVFGVPAYLIPAAQPGGASRCFFANHPHR